MQSLVDRIEYALDSSGTLHLASGDAVVDVSWRQLHDEARAMAAEFQALGVGPGSHVGILGPTTRPLVTAIQATWLAGATLVVLPLPMRLSSIEEFVRQTRTRLLKADTTLLLIDPELAAFVEPVAGDPPMLRLDDLVQASTLRGADGYTRPADDLSRLAILQFTSGSTSEPKGVMLPEHVLCSNLDAIAEAGRLQPDDVFVSWLPLYHDMGLVGMLTVPMTTGQSLVLGAPQDFLGSPARWLQWLSDYRGTVTAGPNFSYVLAARALRRMSDLDLSPMRIALNGAEPVDPATVEAFIAEAGRFGMRPGAVFPAFGMAEVSIAGAFPVPLAGLVTDSVDRKVLESERYAAPADPSAPNARSFVRLGRPVPGLQMRVVDPSTGRKLRDREVGELEIRGTSVTPGYYENPEATAAAFRNDWLRTGDLAYLLDGELVLCGRIKDVIILGGRNVFPEDVERAVADVEGVRAGNVIAFSVDSTRGKEHLVVVAETKSEAHDEIRRQVHHRATEAAGAPPHDIVLVSAGTLPKTSSGKPQRSLCRARYLEDALQPA